MKITKTKLKRLIKEEIDQELDEGFGDLVRGAKAAIPGTGLNKEKKYMALLKTIADPAKGGDPNAVKFQYRLGEQMQEYFSAVAATTGDGKYTLSVEKAIEDYGCVLPGNPDEQRPKCLKFLKNLPSEFEKYETKYFRGDMLKNKFEYKGDTIGELYRSYKSVIRALPKHSEEETKRRLSQLKEEEGALEWKVNFPDFSKLPDKQFKTLMQKLEKYVAAFLKAIEFLRFLHPSKEKDSPLAVIEKHAEGVSSAKRSEHDRREASRARTRRQREKDDAAYEESHGKRCEDDDECGQFKYCHQRWGDPHGRCRARNLIDSDAVARANRRAGIDPADRTSVATRSPSGRLTGFTKRNEAMKLTKTKLKRIIQEELAKILKEN